MRASTWYNHWGQVTSREALELIRNELLGSDAIQRDIRMSVSRIDALYVENLKRIVEVSSEGWRLLATWGSETNPLDPSQRSLALKIGRAITSGQRISTDEAERSVVILDRANDLGFEPTAPEE